MKKILLILVYVLVPVIFLFSQKLVILHTNDMHSKLTGFGPEASYTPMTLNDDETLGGFARLATLFEEEKKQNPGAVFICDGGDFLMGTIFQVAEPQTGFQISLMKQIGYDAIAIGNHEFDYGPENLANVINSGLKKGEIPQLLNSQIQFSVKHTEDDELEKLYKNQTIKPYHIFERNGLKLGVFGIIGKEAVMVAPDAYPVTFTNMFKTAKNIVKILREEEKVDIIICLSHSGIYPDIKTGKMIGEDVDLAKKVPDIDDGFAKELGEFNDLKSLREEIKKNLLQSKQAGSKRELADEIIEQISEKVNFELPESLVQQETLLQLRRMVSVDPRRSNLRDKEIEQMRNEARLKADKNLKNHLILMKIADLEKIKVEDTEVADEMREIAKRNNIPYAQVVEQINREGKREDIKNNLMIKKTVDFLLENAII